MKECEIILAVTEDCNLACDYCYIKQNTKAMSKDRVDYVYKNLSNILDFYKKEKYRITYFGGEPLMNWEVVSYAIEKFNEDKRCFAQLLVTNGLLLTERKVEYLKSINDLYVTISFDGLWNETNRPLSNGESSLDVYMKRKDLINSIAEHTRVMVQPNCVDTMTENFVFLTEKYGQPNCQWWLVRDDIWKEEDIQRYDRELKRLTDKNIEYFENGINAMCGLLLNPIMEMYNSSMFEKRNYSCISGCHGLSISTGRYGYPCTRFLTNYKYPIFDTETSSFIDKNYNIFDLKNERNTPGGTVECKGCVLYNTCNRGCKYSELVEENGEVFFKPLESICKLYKIGYRESIRMMNTLSNNELFRNSIKELTKKKGS